VLQTLEQSFTSPFKILLDDAMVFVNDVVQVVNVLFNELNFLLKKAMVESDSTEVDFLCQFLLEFLSERLTETANSFEILVEVTLAEQRTASCSFTDCCLGAGPDGADGEGVTCCHGDSLNASS
jgi:hypothetical protein